MAIGSEWLVERVRESFAGGRLQSYEVEIDSESGRTLANLEIVMPAGRAIPPGFISSLPWIRSFKYIERNVDPPSYHSFGRVHAHQQMMTIRLGGVELVFGQSPIHTIESEPACLDSEQASAAIEAADREFAGPT